MSFLEVAIVVAATAALLSQAQTILDTEWWAVLHYYSDECDSEMYYMEGYPANTCTNGTCMSLGGQHVQLTCYATFDDIVRPEGLTTYLYNDDDCAPATEDNWEGMDGFTWRSVGCTYDRERGYTYMTCDDDLDTAEWGMCGDDYTCNSCSGYYSEDIAKCMGAMQKFCDAHTITPGVTASLLALVIGMIGIIQMV
ncbi:hypothetical protein Pelo_120 [Pelomyxa schiedti]|nr:hypothetical protein Pelo_120 [Pelomyxa schiedti]